MSDPEQLLSAVAEAQARAVAAGEVTAVDLVEASLARLERHEPLLNAFTQVLADEARVEAAARDAWQSRGKELGPLHGVPIAIKDEYDVAGTVTSYGGDANRTPALRDSEVTRRLREAGAVIVGKTTMPEFGAWPFTESARFGTTRNPWAPGHTPGGSSGGTAAAVAAGIVPVGLGGDGGGSIRIPSACCGLFGLKPTRGRVSAYPSTNLWGALGTTGPLTRSVVDSALVYDVLRGNVDGDPFPLADPPVPFLESARLTTAESQRKLRVGWAVRSTVPGIKPAPEHVRAVEETAALLEGLGHEVREIDPRYPDATTAFVPQFFHGIRSSAASVEVPADLERTTKQTVALGAWVRPRVVAAAMRRGEKLAALVDERVFTGCDVLLTPTIAHRPPRVGRLEGANVVTASWRAQPMIAYTGLWNTTGHPAASVPAGTGDDGLPLAVQLVAGRGDEATLFALSAQVESVRPWADAWPPLG
ncbi:amidase [Nocardioides caldifontis]|uniref:amidase n=1 Tax=Nocardioides caldifontis TaxID=2588938 RepID=UPI0011DF7E1E|nr:amidase [Nocardioides caldifontis]